MRVLVTGGAGYVGTLLVANLLQAGHRVTLLDNFTFGVAPIMHLASHPRLIVKRMDVCDTTYYTLARHDVVVHLAALSGYSQCEADPGQAVAVNVHGTRAIVAALDPAQLLIYASTTSLYGPPTLYARTKAEAERLVMERPNSVAIRWATLFGIAPRMRHELLPNAFTRQAVQRGHIDLYSPDQRRTFMHVRDAASAYVLAMERADEMVGRVWDVGDSGLTCSKRQLVEHIAQQVPCDYTVMEQPDADGRDLDVDFCKAAAIGFDYRSEWRERLPELVRLYGFWREEAA